MRVTQGLFIFCTVFVAILLKGWLFPEFSFWIEALIAGAIGGGAALLSERFIKD